MKRRQSLNYEDAEPVQGGKYLPCVLKKKNVPSEEEAGDNRGNGLG